MEWKANLAALVQSFGVKKGFICSKNNTAIATVADPNYELIWRVQRPPIDGQAEVCECSIGGVVRPSAAWRYNVPMAAGGLAPPLDTAGGGHSVHWQGSSTVTTGRPACTHQLLDWQPVTIWLPGGHSYQRARSHHSYGWNESHHSYNWVSTTRLQGLNFPKGWNHKSWRNFVT